MLEYARWKYILVGVVLRWRCCSPCRTCSATTTRLQIARKDRTPIDAAAAREHREPRSSRHGVTFTRVELDDGNVIVRFADNDAQLKGARRRQGREDRPQHRPMSTR